MSKIASSAAQAVGKIRQCVALGLAAGGQAGRLEENFRQLSAHRP